VELFHHDGNQPADSRGALCAAVVADATVDGHPTRIQAGVIGVGTLYLAARFRLPPVTQSQPYGAGKLLHDGGHAQSLGINTQPLTCTQAEARHMLTALQQDTIFALQAGLLLFGFWMAVRILRHRVTSVMPQGQVVAGWHILFLC